MERQSDGLSPNRVCDITGVLAQTRATWVERGLLREVKRCRELDVIEQAVLKELLARLPKSHVPVMWEAVQKHLRSAVIRAEVVLVWDPEARHVEITDEEAVLRKAVCHGRPVQVLPLGEFVVNTRQAYKLEMDARRRAQAVKAQRTGGNQRRAGSE